MMWNITRLPVLSGSAPDSSSVAGDVYDQGARKSARKKIAPFNRTRSSTSGTTSNVSPPAGLTRLPLNWPPAAPDPAPGPGYGVSVMSGVVSVMASVVLRHR